MRLKLKLKLVSTYNKVPINYNYNFSAAIYLLLKFGSEEFSRFLHDVGYKADGRKFKLFTFAVSYKSIKLAGNDLELIEPYAYLYVSSPLIDTFINNFVLGTFHKQNIFINSNNESAKFEIEQVEAEPKRNFNTEEKFKLYSPLVCSTMTEKDGKLVQYYYRYDDKGLAEGIKNNLIHKYKALHQQEPHVEFFEFEFDKKEIERKKVKLAN